MLASRTLSSRAVGLALTAGIVELTLTTAYIHFSLGGLLFMLNAAGYAALATAIVVGAAVRQPFLARLSWLPRLGLAGWTATTIGAYLVTGPYFDLGWITKAIEVAILTLLAADVVRVYGSPAGLVRAIAGSFRTAPGRSMLAGR